MFCPAITRYAQSTSPEVLMRRFTKCLMLAGLLAGCDAAAGPSEPANSAAPTPSLATRVSERFVVTEPFSEVFDNPCNGTSVQVIGEIVHTFHGVTEFPARDPSHTSRTLTGFREAASGRTAPNTCSMTLIRRSSKHPTSRRRQPPSPPLTPSAS